MEYITITSDSYEKAVSEARSKYGSRVRIISRRDFTVGGGLFKRKRQKSEIVCYLAKEEDEKDKGVSNKDIKEFEKEAKTPDPEKLSFEEKKQTVLTQENELDSARALLEKNEITEPLLSAILNSYTPSDDLVISLGDAILSYVKIDHEDQAHPKKYMLFLGPTGSGKTTTLAKVASLYKSVSYRVAIITLDSYRVGAYEQIKAFADAFSVPLALVKDEDEIITAKEKFKDYDLVLVDTMGVSPDDAALNLRLRGLLSLFSQKETMNILVSPANLKCSDLMKQYKRYRDFSITSLIITKLDESESIGSSLTFSYVCGKPLLFCTNGQAVPDDIRKVSTTLILEYLTGFGLDMKSLSGQLS